jgi:cyclic pyranopterin phosphate synthase
MPIGDVAAENRYSHLSNDTVKEIINNFSPLERTDGQRGKADGPAQVYRMKGAAGEIGLISSMSHQFCDSCNRLRLTAEGHLRACLLSDDEVNLKSILRSGCSDSDLEDLIKKAILDKPKVAALHCYESQRKKCIRNMSLIGG